MAYLGESGSFSESALWAYLEGQDPGEVDPVSCTSFEQIGNLMSAHMADAAIMPVESTQGGVVDEALKVIKRLELQTEGEYWLDVDLCLIGHPDADLSDIKTVFSHPIALRQCKDFLAEHDLEAKEGDDTASAVRELHGRDDPTEGAIASERAAFLYNMKILEPHVQDKKRANRTRFVWVRAKDAA